MELEKTQEFSDSDSKDSPSFKEMLWEMYTDVELQKIVRDDDYLTSFQLDAMQELNRRAIKNPIK